MIGLSGNHGPADKSGNFHGKEKTAMNGRLNFPDTLRTFTIGLVVFHHVTILYTPQFQFVNTFVRNPVPDKFNLFFLLLLVLISGPMLNAIMFFIAGYFAFASYEKRGARAFVKDKLKKLGIPYLLGLAILSPFTLFITRLSRGGNVSLSRFWIREFFLPKTISPLHLWFIGILLIFFIVFTPLLARLEKKKNPETRENHCSRTLMYILFLLVTFAVYFGLNFFYKPYNFLSIYIVNFPVLMLPIYAGYFLLGIYASRRGWFNNENKEYVFPWVMAFAANTVLYFGTVVIADIDPGLEINHPLLAFASNGMTFSGVFLMIAVFRKYQNKTSLIKAWLLKNSYGAYIVHYLIVFGLVYFMLEMPLPVLVKYLIQILICPCLAWIAAGLLKKYTPLRNLL
jgi:hypothetical protein